MSIATLCSDFTATLERQGETVDGMGFAKYAWSTANRTSDGLSTSISAAMQTLTSEERAEYGIIETDVAWCMYTATDPKLTTEDRVTWTDNSGVARACRVHGPSFDMAGKNRIWLTIIQEQKNWD